MKVLIEYIHSPHSNKSKTALDISKLSGVSVKQALEIYELIRSGTPHWFDEAAMKSLEKLGWNLYGKTEKDIEKEKRHKILDLVREQVLSDANKWYETLPDKEKSYVKALSEKFSPVMFATG